MEDFNFDILNLLSILVAAWIGGAVVREMGYPVILGELIIGFSLGRMSVINSIII
jgi:Kef-type K+ transport system membrane component KefB